MAETDCTDARIPEDRKKRLDSIFDALSIIAEDTYVYLCDMRYDYSRWSGILVDVFGLPSEYMFGAGSIWEEHIHPQDRKVFHDGIEGIFEGRLKGHDMQYRARRADGEYDVCTCRGVVFRDIDGNPEYFGGAIRNHSNQSHVDTLTGLRNQYGFFEDLQSYIRRGTAVRICMIGISRFTEINEVYGYHFGNMVLQEFGRYLLEHVGNRGGTYRLDGAKFAMVTESQNAPEIRESYEALRTHYREGVSIGQIQVTYELNAGLLSLSHFNIDDQTIYACLNFAYDESKIKRLGDLVEFQDELTGENRQRLEKIHAIRACIPHDYKGFFLLYQPVVDVNTEKLIGAEALLRWKSEEYGVVPPDLFIPLLEKDPLFPSLGEWILETALVSAKKMLKKHSDFVINVNLSYTQLEKADFTDMVIGILKKNNFPPEHLCLEITERCRLLDLDLLKNIVVKLRAVGIRVALDDFGTGFSSVGLIKELPIDTIKIDRSFVKTIEMEKKDRKLISYLASLASNYGARVCVEGIETAGMRDILRQYGIHSLQGYYYSRPIEIEELLKWNEDTGR
ncbi:MAG TPA: diguanylate cyclase [Lachnospiraceae bacterium]|nr:diguanylate cyclase [Lachnospiraceae bacterium]